MSVDDFVFAKVDVAAFRGDAFDRGSVAIGADEMCGVDGLERSAPGVWGNADALLRESRHLPAPLGESVAADVFQADVERVVLLEFFEDREIRLGLAVGAEGFFATVGDEVILQTSPVGDGFVKRFLDPEERDIGNSLQKSDHGFDGETVVAVDQDFDVRKGLTDGVDDVDVALEAAVGYLEVLRALASWRIQKNDVDLTRKNLGIAKQREAVGYSGRSDVLRWESRFVTSTTDLLELRNEVDRAKMKLNVILNRPVAEPFAAQEVDLAGDGYLDRTGGLGQHIDTPSSLATLTNFLVEEAVRLSPEARQVAANIDALERTSRSLRRRPWIPSIGFGADYGHVFSWGGTGSDVQGSNPVDDQWALSLSASIPLFAGGSQRIAARQTGVEVTALKLQAEKVYQALEFNVRSAMLDVVVSNVNLEASARSAELSRESLGLVQDEYARGRAPMADLIDAQNATLSDNLSVQISEYRFLSSALQLERAVGEYGMLRTPAEQQRFSERFDTYLNESNR